MQKPQIITTVARSAIVVAALLCAWPAVSGPLSDNPKWKACLAAGGNPRTCGKQVLGTGTPNSSPGTPRSFTPGSALSPAQQAEVSAIVQNHPAVAASWSRADDAWWRTENNRIAAASAMNRAINAQNTADDGRSRAINAQSLANDARNRAIHLRDSLDRVFTWGAYWSVVR